ncbi:lysylphosphatidylglycerol synthase transmembrane domain-containing protein [Aggregatilinea lenta]|uniref:lysylphosphatidylglycerol synthase transmembrane domain-containing protein n=1 Tax=Aggregatilinea lenta TaxID=913108 RepID=UPI000E5B2892|nr:lysylphosphatidylglycerol synthase transmembrane domain-containing protein [Aggregatilinea lenta]
MTNSTSPSQSHEKRSVFGWLMAHRARIWGWLRIVIAAVLMIFVVELVSRDSDKLHDVNWSLIPLAWGLMLVSTVIKALRWGLLVRQSRMDVPFRRLLGTYLVGSFFSTVLPTSVGGDAVRAVDMASSTGRVADSTSSVLIERGFGLLAVIGSGSLFGLFLDNGKVPQAFILVIHGMFIAGIVGIIVLRQGWFMEPLARLMDRLKLGRFVDKVRSMHAALSGHLGRPAVLWQMLILSIVANTLTMGATYLVLTAVTDPIPVASFVPMIALTTTAELIPISIASLGVKESAYVFFLGLAGVGSAEAGMIALIMRVLTWGHALLGGIVFLSRSVRTRSNSKESQTQTS